MSKIEKRQEFSLTIFRELAFNSARLTKIIWRENKWGVIAIVAVLILVSASPFILSGSRALLINELLGDKSTDGYLNTVIWLTGILILASFAPSVFRTIQTYIQKKFWFFLNETFSLMIMRKKGELDIAVHEDKEKSNLLNRVHENGNFRVLNFVDRQFFILENIIGVLIASAILIFINWWLFLIIFILTIPELIIEVRYGTEVWGIWNAKGEIRRRYWNLEGHFQNLRDIVELKLFQNIPYFFKTVKELFKSFQIEAIRSEKKRVLREIFAITFSQIAISFAIFWFVFQVVNGNLLVGTFTFLIASMADLRQSLGGLFQNLGKQYQDNLFVTDVFKLMDLPDVINKPKNGIRLSPDKTPEIVFENVAFAYPGSDKSVLKNISLRIAPGDKTAIVGVNGAGKTTFIKLLCRFYDPTEGRIMIDGHNLKDVDLESWYHQLGIIFQDYSRYHFLVKEAIAIGRTGNESSLEKVKAAAKAGEADIFIEEWEKSYEQMLGKQFNDGTEPSVGQWQKLALARTFYRDPRVLILDEPTSSIDAEAEAKIFDKLENLPDDRTVILISHRFSTVRKAHKIVVIKDGELSESGTHEELLKLNGTYARLFNLQAKGYQ